MFLGFNLSTLGFLTCVWSGIVEVLYKYFLRHCSIFLLSLPLVFHKLLFQVIFGESPMFLQATIFVSAYCRVSGVIFYSSPAISFLLGDCSLLYSGVLKSVPIQVSFLQAIFFCLFLFYSPIFLSLLSSFFFFSSVFVLAFFSAYLPCFFFFCVSFNCPSVIQMVSEEEK